MLAERLGSYSRQAGRKRHMGWRPTVRGSVMNPCDHPHGGGEGRAPAHGGQNVAALAVLILQEGDVGGAVGVVLQAEDGGKDAGKVEIKKAVEEIFGVKVAAVNTLTVPGKEKRIGRS